MPLTRLRDVPAEISAMREFTGSSMSARVVGRHERAVIDPGLLRGADLERFLADRASSLFYVVFSYATPIAWVVRGRDPYIVEQQFSMTTSSKHMPQVLDAWAEWVPTDHRLAEQARWRSGRSSRSDRVRINGNHIPPSTEGTEHTIPVTSMVNPSHIHPGGEYPWDAIKRENAEREAQLPLTDRIAALIGE